MKLRKENKMEWTVCREEYEAKRMGIAPPIEEEFDEEDTFETECPFSLAELEIKEIEFGTLEGVREYLRQKGEL